MNVSQLSFRSETGSDRNDIMGRWDILVIIHAGWQKDENRESPEMKTNWFENAVSGTGFRKTRFPNPTRPESFLRPCEKRRKKL